MPPAGLTDDELKAVVDAYELHGSYAGAARALNMLPNTFRGRYEQAVRRGLVGFDPVMAGFEVSRASTNTKTGESWVRQVQAPGPELELPPGHVVKGVSALVDQDGRVRQKWVKTREGDMDPLQVAEWLKSAFDGYATSHEPTVAPEPLQSDLLNLYPCNDWHINMMAWERESGSNWDLKLAEQRIGSAEREAIDRSPIGELGIVLGGGDLLHADNKEARTAASGHTLDVDSRYQKGVEVVTRMMVTVVERALTRNRRVLVRILPGNHDEHTSVAITYFLAAWFRNDPRVEVDTDPSLFFWHRFGKVLIGSTHGHTVRVQDMAQVMAHRRAEDWGKTRFRYVHGFHLHHSAKYQTEGGGVVSEVHQAPIPQDAWHYGSGFLSGRSVQAITYHAEHGEIGRARVAVLDA